MKTYCKKRFWTTILVVQIISFYIASKSKFIISAFQHFFEVQKKAHQLIFSWIPFSFGDLFYTLLLFTLIALIIKTFKKNRKAKPLLQILILINCMYFFYQIFWGMLYFQKPIFNELLDEKITLDTRKKLALKYLNLCKISRNQVTQDKNGVFKLTNIKNIETEILKQQKYLPDLVPHKKTNHINSIKPSLYGKIMSFTGILGYYNPFTAEAQYNANLPATLIPFTLAHETSHQLGFAREQEANFIGYLVGIQSQNTELKYSTQYYTLKSLLNSIIDEDETFVKTVLEEYSEGMKKDRQNEKEFFTKHESYLNQVFSFTNNLFLKTNQQEGSITYSYFIKLLVKYETLEK